MNQKGTAKTTIPVPQAIAELLHRLWDGEPFDDFDVPKFDVVQFDGVDVSDCVPVLQISGDRLRLTIADLTASRPLYPLNFGGELLGSNSDGAKFGASFLLRAHRSHALQLDFAQWSISTSIEPSLWLTKLEGRMKLHFSGNLIVERARGDGLRLGAPRHFRLAGEYTYYLVQHSQEAETSWSLLVDTGASGAPNTEALARDFLLLQFVLGRRFRMSPLLGLSNNGDVIACASGCDPIAHRTDRPIPPVPLERDNNRYVDEAWAPLFFELVSKHWKAKPESIQAYMMVFSAYLDSTTNYLDADYLRLQVALEAFAYWDLRMTSGEEKLVVQDKKSWKAWVKANGDAIRRLAADGFAQSLYDKVLGVYRLSSGRVVASAFIARGQPLNESMLAEVEARNVVAHQGMMSPDGYDADRDIGRIALIRSLLIALVARSVGYAGAIRGWTVGTFGHPVEPSEWWEVNEADRARAKTIFNAE